MICASKQKFFVLTVLTDTFSFKELSISSPAMMPNISILFTQRENITQCYRRINNINNLKFYIAKENPAIDKKNVIQINK